ncbi:MAG: tRNA-dihydrouridine synthase [Proteobacteria bacterium]|nr:tRNA-dihydrouridine synthase [Pseudomonadota bacterium]
METTIKKALKDSPFSTLGLSESNILLAPLAGVSDHPFRRICSSLGADLTYVEMISATAMIYESRRTFDMLKRHESEAKLGVQITGRSAEEVGQAIAVLDKMPFDTIDINMGCPVSKVVKNGCGSGILRDPERVFKTVKAARDSTDKPLSAKFRLGWDHQSMNWPEVADAIESGGADWMTIHGRFRSDDYGAPVNLEQIAAMKRRIGIPLIGNGNIFSRSDALYMRECTGVDGVMVSRGALGNPWIFRDLASGQTPVTIDEWEDVVLKHLKWQQEEYGNSGSGAVCMRKHLLWYAKGWPGAKKLREEINSVELLSDCENLVVNFAAGCRDSGETLRADVWPKDQDNRFMWDPKFDMDRKLDRGVGDDQMESIL